MSIFECERDDLSWYRSRFCDFDRFAGLASPAGGMPGVLASLSLDSPWPSTRSNTFRFDAKQSSVEALRRLLDADRTFLFEEVDNGTRLRLLSLHLTRDRLLRAIEPHLDDPSRTPRRRRTEFTVDWPVQGLAYFRSAKSELVLSDVYWMWVFEALGHLSGERELRVPFLVAWDEGFCDPSRVVEMFPVAKDLLVLLRAVTPSMAPSFELVKPTGGCTVPTAERILEDLVCVVQEAVFEGVIEIEIE